MKKSLRLVVLIIATMLSTIVVAPSSYANDIGDDELFRGITYCILERDTDKLGGYRDKFVPEEYNKIREYVNTNKLVPYKGFDISSMVIDYAEVESEQQKEQTVFVNTKCNIEGRINANGDIVERYNKLIMIELHLDESGKIFKHNIWQY